MYSFTQTCTYSVKGVTWAFASFLVIGLMGMLMIMFRSAWLPTTYSDDEKVSSPTVEHMEEIEVECAPYKTEPPPQEEQNTGVAVVTGVAAGAFVDEAYPTIENGGEDSSKAFDDSNWLEDTPTAPDLAGVAPGAAVNEAFPPIENGSGDAAKVFDDSNWLDDTTTAPEPPTAPNY